MEEVKFFSADSHVNEPPEAWERIPKQLREHGLILCRIHPGKKVFTWFLMVTSPIPWA